VCLERLSDSRRFNSDAAQSVTARFENVPNLDRRTSMREAIDAPTAVEPAIVAEGGRSRTFRRTQCPPSRF
jgi:hypothetical protein